MRLIILIYLSCFITAISFAQNIIGYSLSKKSDFSEQHISRIKELTNEKISIKNTLNSIEDNFFLIVEIKPNYRDSSSIIQLRNIFESVPFLDYISPIKQFGSHYVSHLPECIIKVKPGVSLNYIVKKTKDLGLEYLNEDKSIENCFIFSMNKSTISYDSIKSKINNWEHVEWINRNSFFSLLTNDEPDDTYWEWQWALHNIGSIKQSLGTPGADLDVLKAWEISRGNPNIKIAVFDSGVDTQHAELSHCLLTGYDALNQGTNGYPSLDYDEDGHGTCCSGIIGAQYNNSNSITGIAPNCKIVPVRVFMYINLNGEITGYTTHIWAANAMAWAWQDANIDVVNNSYGIPDYLLPVSGIDTTYSNNAIKAAVKNGRNGQGLPMLFSSGNEPDSVVIWPASFYLTLSIGASNMCDKLKTVFDCSNVGWGANYGQGLDCVTPGVKIATIDMVGSNGYRSDDYHMTFGGTSASCPYAAGIVGLMLSVNPLLTYEQIKNILLTTAEKVGEYQYNLEKTYGTWSTEMGYGRLNAFEALKKAQAISIDSVKETKARIYYDSYQNAFLEIELEETMNISINAYNTIGQRIASHNMNTDQGKHIIPVSSLIENYQGIVFFDIDLNNNFYRFNCWLNNEL